MLAMNYRGPYRVRADHEGRSRASSIPSDAIVRVDRSCICGSDLHLYHGLVPDTRVGTTFGHEFIGRVEAGRARRCATLKVGDNVLVPFNIFCGSCFFCQRELYGNCHDTNPEATAVGGIYGYSHTTGGYDGGQAEYVRVPMADVGPTVIPDDIAPRRRGAADRRVPDRLPGRRDGRHQRGRHGGRVRRRPGRPVRGEVGVAGWAPAA